MPTREELLAAFPDDLAAIVRNFKNDENCTVFKDRNEWIKLGHAIKAAFDNEPELGQELWDGLCLQRGQKNEPGEVWDGLGYEHRSGEAYILKIAEEFEECRDDVARYKERIADKLSSDAFAAAPLPAAELGLADPGLIAQPDMSVLRLNRRPPPALPLDVFGPVWRRWIEEAAEAAAAPVDYVVGPLLASVSTLIGNARWPQATAGWTEPPHLWCAAVGDSGSSKSPGADAIMRDVIPVLEACMTAGHSDRVREWEAAMEMHAERKAKWKDDLKKAASSNLTNGITVPSPGNAPSKPETPRLRQTDVTIEKVAYLLANAAPKGLLIVRDELARWLLGMTTYNDAGRQFWLEAYGGRPYRVERKNHPEPIDVPRLVVAVTGSIQPEKLAELMREADDGLLARFLWFWPETVPFKLGKKAPNCVQAADALDRLRQLDLAHGLAPKDTRPFLVPLAEEALADMEAFGREMQEHQQDAAGLMRSEFGKARGTALRLSLVIELMRWCAEPGASLPPGMISRSAFLAAAILVRDYYVPMAERVYGDAAIPVTERNTTTLARWIMKNKPKEVYVTDMIKKVRLPNLREAGPVHAACGELVDAGWLFRPGIGAQQQRARQSYSVNPNVWKMVHENKLS